MDELLREMELKGLARTGSAWLKRAVTQKPSRMSIFLASSALLVYDRMDRMVAKVSRLN